MFHNYVRKARISLSDRKRAWTSEFTQKMAKMLLKDLESGQAFAVPEEGFTDKDLTAYIPETLRLPFQTTLIETFIMSENRRIPLVAICSEELNGIVVKIVVQATPDDWWPVPATALVHFEYSKTKTNGYEVHLASHSSPDGRQSCHRALKVCMAEMLGLIAMLACSNVSIKKTAPFREITSKEVRRGVLPFDAYHVLTLPVRGGSISSDDSGPHNGRSPREHLRRGHIRRYAPGKTTWINQTLVNAGAGSRIEKAYNVTN